MIPLDCEASQLYLIDTDKLASVVGVCHHLHLENTANFALLAPYHRWLWHHWDSSLQSGHKMNAFLLSYL